MPRPLAALLAVLAFALASSPLAAQQPIPACGVWDQRFAGPTIATASVLNAAVTSFVTYDDGQGPGLYVGGDLETGGGIHSPGVVRWTPNGWQSLGTGPDAPVYALAVFDDGAGPELYAGGQFTFAGGLPVNRIARWKNSTWSDVGGGGGGTGAFVDALAVHDDGSGPALYAGGIFTTAGGVSANNVAKWNGSSWSALGSGTSGRVSALTSHADALGTWLAVGGEFANAGGIGVGYVARWQNGAWSSLATGLSANVTCLRSYNDGSGRALYVGGYFQNAGTLATSYVARWQSGAWSALSGGTDGSVTSLGVFNDGSGPALYVGGLFDAVTGVPGTRHLARWKNSTWEGFQPETGAGFGVSDPIDAFALFAPGGATRLYATGEFADASALAVGHVASWDGSAWSALGAGLDGPGHALGVWDAGSGAKLYVGGSFGTAGGTSAPGIASWNGTQWAALGGGLTTTGGAPGAAYAVTAWNDGTGSALYVGGSFDFAGGVAASNLARWDGANWSAVGGGVAGTSAVVRALHAWNDGTGNALYVGGVFVQAGSVAAANLARWDGTQWSALGAGLTLGSFDHPGVHALLPHDDGGGTQLYVAGSFSAAGTVATHGIARWNGATWSAVGGGLVNIAGEGVGRALRVFDTGAGPRLAVGGRFTNAGTISAHHLAAWTGSTWTQIGDGMGSVEVRALGLFEDGADGHPDLFVGGWFGYAGLSTNNGAFSQNIASFRGCAATGTPFCFGDGSGTACPCGNASATGAQLGCLNSSTLGGSLRATGWASVTGDTAVLLGSNMPGSTAVFLDATTAANGGLGVVFGDGLLCLGVPAVRVATKTNVSGASSFPAAGDPSLSVASAALPGVTHYYQIDYRDVVSFCTVDGFNLTNGYTITWVE